MPEQAATQEQTFLFADLAGFTALTEAHGDEPAADIVDEFCSAVGDLLHAYGAEQIKTIGDALMLRVTDPTEAVRLGLRIVGEIGDKPGFPVIRVGMHTGTAIERDGDWFGSTVNIAARVSAAAGGGEVLLTEATRARLGAPKSIQLQRRGEQRFKNLGDPVTLYRATRISEVGRNLVTDPVCRMAVDPNRAAGVLLHHGVPYRFCSLRCARAFAADPARYANEVDSADTE